MTSGLDLLNKIAKIADSSTDDMLSDAVKRIVMCDDEKCELCPINQDLINLLRKLREARKAERRNK